MWVVWQLEAVVLCIEGVEKTGNPGGVKFSRTWQHTWIKLLSQIMLV